MSLAPLPPSAIDAGPVHRFDGLAADAPPRALAPRPRVLSNPFLRLVLFALLLAASVVVTFVVITVATRTDLRTPGNPGQIAGWIVANCVAYGLLVWLVEARRPAAEVALRRLPVGLLAGLLLGAAAFAVCYLGIVALGGLKLVGAGTVTWPHWWYQVAVVGASAGITEEIMFRGVAFRFVEEFLGTWVAVVLTGGLFGAAHLSNPDATVMGAVGIAVAGLVFGLLYAVTRNLWLMMGFHAAWNVVQGPVLGVIVSGTGAPDGLLRSEPGGSDLVSGGVFGAEASVVTLVVMAVLAALLSVRLARRSQAVAPMWTRRARQRRALEAGLVPDVGSLDAKQRRAQATGSPVVANPVPPLPGATYGPGSAGAAGVSVPAGVESVGQHDPALDGDRHPGDPRGLV